MMQEDEFSWDLGELPFIWRPLDGPRNGGGLPDALPFTITLDAATGLLRQEIRTETRQALSRAYELGSEVTGMMEKEGLGRQYADDFLAFLSAKTKPGAAMRVLEIGCGTGYLLSRLAEQGCAVIGIEPGEHGAAGAERHGVPVIRDFFPSPRLEGQFDLAIIYGVLEHMEDPAGFLRQIGERLSPGGRIAIAVPACAPYVEQGDVSMLFHEHWNYFEAGTLGGVIAAAGFGALHIGNAGYGGLLYALAGKEGGKPAAPMPKSPDRRARRFRALAESMLARFAGEIEAARQASESLGIYIPSRAVNALKLTGAPLAGIRFFDDNPVLHGSYFPGIDIAVEPRAGLLETPTDRLVIFSHTFGEKLRAELAPVLPQTRILTWSDLFGATTTTEDRA